jgi:hypothetical protein
MLLRPGRIKAKGEKAKSTTIDATGHAEYNEDAPLRFSVSARESTFLKTVGQHSKYSRIVQNLPIYALLTKLMIFYVKLK